MFLPFAGGGNRQILVRAVLARCAPGLPRFRGADRADLRRVILEGQEARAEILQSRRWLASARRRSMRKGGFCPP